MRYFTFDGPYSLNGYAEIPETAPVDYFDEVYKGIEVWWGLTFGGWGIIRNNEIIQLVSGDGCFKWASDGTEVTKESIKTHSKFYQTGDEIINLIGFDDNHIERCPNYIIDEAENLANQIDKVFKVIEDNK